MLALSGLFQAFSNVLQRFLILVEPGLSFGNNPGWADDYVVTGVLNQKYAICKGLSQRDSSSLIRLFGLARF